jgi:hypothetical protein
LPTPTCLGQKAMLLLLAIINFEKNKAMADKGKFYD